MTSTIVRRFAAAVAVAIAALYLLIGLGVLDIGTTASGETPELFDFGVALAGLFLAMGLMVLLLARRVVWAAIGITDLLIIAGYFLLGDIRHPSFELWGLLIKALQGVFLVTLAILVMRPRSADEVPGAQLAPMHR
ncbi:MAG TPA: hypothetical protein VFM03_07520 [Candidatus Limnocylindria bacterium]|nr:hypothetical protein [Candidatus Limnocylindria bacterium]